MKKGRLDGRERVMPCLAAALVCALAGNVPAQGSGATDREAVATQTPTKNLPAGALPLSSTHPGIPSSLFVPVIVNASGRHDSFFTSELTLTNRGSEEATLHYIYTAYRGGGSGMATDTLAPGQQRINPDAIGYLSNLGIPIPHSGNRIGTLRVDVTGSSEVSVVVRTTTAVPEGRAGLAFPGIPGHEGFQDEAVYLCGLRQNGKDRSNVAIQNMGSEGSITLRTTVFSGEAADTEGRRLEDRTLKPGGFYQYNQVLNELGSSAQGYVKVERVDGKSPFYAYGVINDQANSDGSFVFPVGESSLAGAMGQTLPVVIEVGPFTSELTVTNFSDEAKAVSFRVVADAIDTADGTVTFVVPLEAGQQHIIPNAIDTARRQFGLNLPSGLAVPLFARAVGTDMSGIVIGARTGSPADPQDSSRGQYSVFYTAVPRGAGFTDGAWVVGLQQNEENRSNLALVNTGEVDDSDIVFTLEIYDGETAMLVNTVSNADTTVAAKRWHQINGILRKYGKGATQGFVRIKKMSGNNPFLAYGVVNDGGVPRQRSDDGAYLPAVEERIHDTGTVPMTDREVLEALYHATGGPDWINRTNWLSTAPLSEWFGVVTDGNGRVKRLSLGYNRLSGEIPPELGQLNHLSGLELPLNKLSGAIPPELGNLRELQSLFLYNNELSGGIPPELARLTQLQKLELRDNRLSGPIPPELSRLIHLEKLILGNNRLSGLIPPELGGLTHLWWLQLKDNDLSGQIPPELAGMTRLQVLELSSNDLIGAIPKNLQQLSKLTSLDIQHTNLCVPADAAFQAWLDTLTEFRTSGLVCDGTRRVLFSAASYEVKEGETVEVVVRLIDRTGDVDWSAKIPLTVIPGEGATVADYSGVPESVTITAPATEAGFDFLAVADAPFDTGETVVLGFRQPLPSGLTAGSPDKATVKIHDPGSDALTDREVLEALYHTTSGPNWLRSANWLSTAPLSVWSGVGTDGSGRVTSLSLSRNRMRGTIPFVLGQLSRLQVLDLGINQLTGEIPPELAELANLQVLNLHDNQLSGQIPPALAKLTHLQELNFNRNGLIGKIPAELAELTHLRVLDLGGNQLIGEISPLLGGLIDLQVLNLHENQLTAEIPQELAGLIDLQVLNLRFNQLKGAIPAELGGLTHLQVLDLGINQLTGEIPPELGHVTHLQVLDLGGNRLNGEIPSELGGLTHLQELHLNVNKLSGKVPPKLGQLTQLQRLNLHGNRLSGEIPPELGRLTQLQGLHLNVNELSGEIPAELARLTQLRWLPLSGNQLSGEIPRELGGLTQLQWLGIGENEVSGAIPPELGDLTRLQGLDLGGSRLSGTIPAELAQLTQLNSLNLGFNSDLTGTIPQGLQQLPLTTLHLMGTSVCVPEDTELQEWMAMINQFTPSGLICGLSPAEMSSIDILVVYTPAARRIVGGTAEIEAMIDLMIAETNQAYQAGGVKQRLVLVAREEVEYNESENSNEDFLRLVEPSDGYMDEVHAIRDRAGADLVHLIAESYGGGIALQAAAFGLTGAGSDSGTFAHETGHNMGLAHDRYAMSIGLSPYGHGYVNQKAFVGGAPDSASWITIMAYPNQCSDAGFSCNQIMRFSNPNQTYLGDPLGVPGDQRTRVVDGPADAVRALNLTRHSVAGFRPRASGHQMTMPSTLSQARPMVRTDVSAALFPGGSLFRATSLNERGAASQRADDVVERATLRRREVRIDMQRLARVVEGEPRALRLNLFDNVVLTGIIERWMPTFSGGTALSGRLAGVPEGTVTLVVNGSVVVGTVRLPSTTYRIRPDGAGRHSIMQVDPSLLPQGCEVVSRTLGRE